MIIKKPNSCVVLLTLRCNLHCSMCNLGDNHEDVSDYASLEDWIDFFDSLSENCDESLNVIFGGGEPLLYKDKLITLVKYAAEKGFRTSLATSGYLMDEETAYALGQAGLDYIAFTVYSLDKKKHDEIRRTDGALQMVKKSVEWLSKLAPQVEIAVDTVIMKPNLRDLIKLTEWVKKDKRLSRIMFQAVMQPFHTKPESAWYRKDEFSFLWPDIEEACRIIDKLKDIKIKENEKGEDTVVNSLSQFDVFKRYFSAPNEFVKKDVCMTHNNGHFGVLPNGAVTLCPYMKAVGNIKEQGIDEILYGDCAGERRDEILRCHQNCHHVVNCWYEE